MSRNNRAFATVTVTVFDINDHIPAFEQQFYMANISELAEINETVMANLVAVDPDEVHHYSPLAALLLCYHYN